MLGGEELKRESQRCLLVRKALAELWGRGREDVELGGKGVV